MLVTNIHVMRKAERTRQRLQEEAIKLFTDRGFDGVTVEEIANAAGVSHMTFFRHFPTKESAVLFDPYDPHIGAAVESTDRNLPALDRVRLGIMRAWEAVDEPVDETIRAKARIVAGNPSLYAGAWENNYRTEAVIVQSLQHSGTPRLEARIAAGAVLGALTGALLDWAEDTASGSLGDRIRLALALLEAHE